MIHTKKHLKNINKRISSRFYKYSIFDEVKYYSLSGLQNCLVFLSTSLNLEYISNKSNIIKLWDSIGTSWESFKNPHTSDATFSLEFSKSKYSQFSRVNFKGIRLKQDSVSFLHKKVVDLYIT